MASATGENTGVNSTKEGVEESSTAVAAAAVEEKKSPTEVAGEAYSDTASETLNQDPQTKGAPTTGDEENKKEKA